MGKTVLAKGIVSNRFRTKLNGTGRSGQGFLIRSCPFFTFWLAHITWSITLPIVSAASHFIRWVAWV